MQLSITSTLTCQTMPAWKSRNEIRDTYIEMYSKVQCTVSDSKLT
jgi:hypothetical protein